MEESYKEKIETVSRDNDSILFSVGDIEKVNNEQFFEENKVSLENAKKEILNLDITKKYNDGYYITIFKRTPVVLRTLGLEDKELIIRTDKARRILTDPNGPIYVKDKKGTHYHGDKIDRTILVNSLEKIADPIAIFKATELKNGVRTTLDDEFIIWVPVKDILGNPVTVTFYLYKRAGRHEVSQVKSVFSRDSGYEINKWFEAGLLKYIDKQKALDSVSYGARLEPPEPWSRLSEKNYITRDDIVKKYSLNPSNPLFSVDYC